MEYESGVTRSIIDELHSWHIQGVQMEDESGVTPSVIEELDSWDIQEDQKEGEGGVTRSIIDELHSSGMVKWMGKVVLLKVSLMKLFFGYLRRSNGR